MSKTSLENVISHWSKLIEGLQASPRDYYASLEEVLKRRRIPGLKTSRIDWNEGGVLSPKREYLRITGGRHSFEVCAAPFGTGFFFSSWLTKRAPIGVFAVFLLLVAADVGISKLIFEVLAATWSGPSQLPLGLPNRVVGNVIIPALAGMITLWLVGTLTRVGQSGLELAVLAIPIVGWVYERLFAPETYYRIDTMLMFQSAVHSATMEAIDALTTEQGVRGLSDDDRKPIFHQLV